MREIGGRECRAQLGYICWRTGGENEPVNNNRIESPPRMCSAVIDVGIFMRVTITTTTEGRNRIAGQEG